MRFVHFGMWMTKGKQVLIGTNCKCFLLQLGVLGFTSMTRGQPFTD